MSAVAMEKLEEAEVLEEESEYTLIFKIIMEVNNKKKILYFAILTSLGKQDKGNE